MYYLNGHSNIIALKIEYTVVTVQEGGSPQTAAYGISFGSLISGKVYQKLNEQALLDQELNESC